MKETVIKHCEVKIGKNLSYKQEHPQLYYIQTVDVNLGNNPFGLFGDLKFFEGFPLQK